MKNLIVLIAISCLALSSYAQDESSAVMETPAIQYKVVTVVESVVPAGLGRSRMIESQTDMEIDDFTTSRSDGKKSEQKDIKRKDAKIDDFDESKMLNFYSVTGINFQNIASNDALISSKLNQMAREGWQLLFVTSGVESDSGLEPDGKGIYITRFIFKK